MTTLTEQPAPAVPVHQLPEMPEQLEIIVTHEDIRGGEARSPYNCAVGRALQRMGYSRAVVNPHGVGLLGYVGQRYTATPEFAEWISRFDDGLPVHPERFVLERGSFRIL